MSLPQSAVTLDSTAQLPIVADTAAPDAQDLIEASDHSEYNSSVTDDRISTYTESIASSIVDYPIENGRRYHAFREGAYPYPNDEAEMDRLDLSHALMKKILGGKLFQAPLEAEKTRRILDIGTGTGIWSIDMGDKFPHAEIIGNDLSAIQPSWVPPNVKFIVDDVESPWVDGDNYDYIMCRCMVSSIKDWPRLFQNVYDHINPGCWAEFQDICIDYYSEDGTLTGDHIVTRWVADLHKAAGILGRDCCSGRGLKGWAEDTGFENIFHRKYKIPVGPWAKDPLHRDIGMHNLVQLLDGLEGFTMRIFCGVLGWSRDDVLVFLAELRKELKSGVYHSMFDFHVVYGQKPGSAPEP
ncbi:umta methyltransferase family protein [Colletotrichum truncatum]|uniref:Umta methyltransferase family protein n=1 Tax=Colletotrichum truncatum TaxID=5467 RepID=A0ACC3YXX2_COLTU|nr:umta methyltransferase family protein [Colletotrichum truncatum]KAF6790956.1 umta methyltransferase family protein [Colletotrichum truncatum]